MSNLKCQDLLGDQPPDFIRTSTSYLNSDRSFWGPYCSILHYSEIGNISDKSFIDEIYEIDKKQITSTFDLCQSNIENQNYEEHIPPTQNKSNTSPMNEAEKNDFTKEITKSINVVAENCCGEKDIECINSMKKVEVKFCENQTNPDLPDKCISSGAEYKGIKSLDKLNSDKINNKLIKLKSQMNNKNFEALIKKQIPEIIVGQIVLSSLKQKNSNKPLIELNIVYHELGHACSYIKSQLDAKKGSRGAFENFYRRSAKLNHKDYCAVTTNLNSFYLKLFNEHKRSEKAVNCFFNLAKQSTQNRFSNEKCIDGCPASVIEESFADSLMFKSLMNNIDLNISSHCNKTKDSYHPLGMDEVKCALMDDEIFEKMKEKTGCKE